MEKKGSDNKKMTTRGRDGEPTPARQAEEARYPPHFIRTDLGGGDFMYLHPSCSVHFAGGEPPTGRRVARCIKDGKVQWTVTMNEDMYSALAGNNN